MKMTLIEIVQDVLNDLDSDEVNHIDDTIEAQQVAQIIKTCYYEMIGNRNWPHTRKLIQLEASGKLTLPNYLILPENLKELTYFKYDKSKLDATDIDIKEVTYKEPDDFLRYVSGRRSSNDTVETIIDPSGTKVFVLNNVAPTYWTSFDDNYILTDSYDRDVDDTLKKSKTQAQAYLIPVWTRADSFVPDLPAEAFPALLAEVKSTASMALKQSADQKAEQKSKRQQSWLSRKAWRAHGGIQYEDYGRKSRR